MSEIINVHIREEDEYIKLGQLLKKTGQVSSGTDAKYLIENGQIFVNNECEHRRGRKLKEGDIVSGDGWSYRVIK